MTRHPPRSLIVVSKDYGEFGFAMSFLRGQELAERATLMLPEGLYFENEGSLSVPAFPYSTLEDILNVADARRPDLVFLFSGYLLTGDRLLTSEAIERLVRGLRDRDCRIVTSDPFVGLSAGLTPAQVDTRMLLARYPARLRWLLRLRLRLNWGQLFNVPSMTDAIHVYATSVPEGDEDPVSRFSFFNPAMVRPDRARAPDGTRRGWLFVLSSTDLHCQGMVTGLLELEQLVARMLRDALEAGRQPTLIGPEWMVERVSKALPDEIELLTSCPFAEFEARVLDAEYVFYWNAFSFSQLSRVANELPVFVFDRGHLAHAIKPFYPVALSCHFGGWETYLDQTRRLDPNELAGLAEEQKPAMRAILAGWRSSATPDELVERLAQDRAAAG